VPHRIYRPDKPEGERFKVTAAKTRLARLYHATSILTAKGDIIVVSDCLQSCFVVSLIMFYAA
jgi:hypothetical protein